MTSELTKIIEQRRRIYLMRHGDVSYFGPSGQSRPPKGVPLNQEGVRQAEAAREVLRGARLDRVVTSGLPRTDETAAIITRGRGIRKEAHAELREISPGPLREISDPNFARDFLSAFTRKVTPTTQFLGGETFGSLKKRAVAALENLIASPGWKELLVVAHGGTNRILLLHALGADLGNLGRMEQDPCCINILDILDDGSLLLRLFNYTPYAPIKEGIHRTTMEKLYLDFQDATRRSAK